MTPGQMQMLNDSALTDAARILGFYLSTLPEGPHELKHSSLAVLLHNTPNANTVGRHLRQLAVHGYAKLVSEGGRGSPVYEWVADSAVDKTQADDALPANKRRENAPIVVDDDALNPPIPLPVLDPKADAAIERYGNLLVGCRDAIRDYLREVVPKARQGAWVDDVAGKLNGLGFNWLGAPVAERAGLVAAGVNELRASGEQGMKYAPGDPRNLRTKLGVLVQDRSQKATGTYGGGRGPPKREQPADAQTYKPTNKFPGFNT